MVSMNCLGTVNTNGSTISGLPGEQLILEDAQGQQGLYAKRN